MLLWALFPRGDPDKISATDNSADADASGLARALYAMNFIVRKRRAPTIIIVSLVDILIILLIFFVVSTTFKKDQPEVQINLQESKTASNRPAELEHAIVSVDQDDGIKLDGQPVGVDELEAAVRDLPAERKSTLALQADKKASWGAIVKVMDALKLAGVKNLPSFMREEK